MAVRLAQLSDMHLTSRADRRCLAAPVWPSFRRALAHLDQGERLDRLVLTGDLAHQRHRDTYRLLGEAVEPWGDRVLAIPGNHDSRPLFRDVFGGDGPGNRATFVDDVDGLRLIGLDTMQPRRVHGRLGDAQLEWLAALLDHDRPTLLFMHHPPVPVGCWWLDKDRVRDADALAAVLRDRPVLAVFTGHVHQDAARRFADVPVFTCPSTAYQFRPRSRVPWSTDRGRPALRIIEWDGGEPVSRVIRLGP